TSNQKFGHKQPEVWSQATGSLVTSNQKFGHKQPEVWSQATGSLVTSNRKFGHKQYGVIYDLPFINPSLQVGVRDDR
ncbi:MAG TPA: hypothetical protein VJ440_05555, partial [Candidatus Brocadiaceae bacterium]|nr:hypothetical protein [Candidatus Brocadiaceae bacterium]